PGWAEAALACFEDSRVAAVAPLVLRWPGGSLIDSAGDRYYVGGVAAKRGPGHELTAEDFYPCRAVRWSGSSGVHRPDVLPAVGAFPESFGAYFEDVDVAVRLHRAGYHVVYEPAARALHHVSSSYGRPRRRLLEQQSRNEELVFWRNLPG